MSDAWLYLRLLFALAVVLAPGWCIARALGARSVSATLAWALTVLFVALGVTFLISASLWITLVLLIGLGLAAAPYAFAGGIEHEFRAGRVALVGGIVLGLLLWHVAGEIGGDGFFHLGRVQKLLAFDDLSLDAVTEFPDGDLHPGYAFPLWHGLLALMARIASTDPSNVVVHGPSVLAPLATLIWAEAGWAVFRRRGAALGVSAAAVSLAAFAPGHGGAYTALALPATSSRQLLVPALLALSFAALSRPTVGLFATVAAAALGLAVVHPTYLIFSAAVFAGFVAVRALWTRSDVLSGLAVLGATLLPALLFYLWLRPYVAATHSANLTADECERARAQYLEQLDWTSCESFHVVPELFGRSGAIAVAALIIAPLAVLSARRRWAALVVGGGLAVGALTLLAVLFVPLSDVVSISQSRRLVGFFPFPFALVGGLGVLGGRIGAFVLPLALGAGVVLQLVWPGDFDYRLTDGGPAFVTWLSVAALVLALLVGRFVPTHRTERAGLAALLLVAPVVGHGLGTWSPNPARPPSFLTAGLVADLRARVKPGDVVYSDPESSYRIAAFTPAKICVAPVSHVADTERNRPQERRKMFLRFVRTGDVAIPRACGSSLVVIDEQRFDLDPGLDRVYDDARFAVYRIAD